MRGPIPLGGQPIDFEKIKRKLRSLEIRQDAEVDRAPNLLAELRRQSPSGRAILICNSPAFQTLALGRLLVREAFEAGFNEPAEALSWAELALSLANALDAGRYDPELIQDARAQALAALGNARRIASDFAGASAALRSARQALASGTGDPLEEARVDVLEAKVFKESRDYPEVFRLLDRAIETYRRSGQSHQEGCTLIDKATCLGDAGQSAQAVPILRRGLRLLDPTREPRRVLGAKHNLIFNLHECGRFAEAEDLLEEVRSLHHGLGNRIDLLRLRWLEANLTRSQRDLGSAERAYCEVKAAFVELGMPFDAALISLDLAKVYLEQERLAEIKSLAAEMLGVFRSLGVHREALAALALFYQAAEQERVSLAWLSSLAGFLEKAQSNSTLRFRPD